MRPATADVLRLQSEADIVRFQTNEQRGQTQHAANIHRLKQTHKQSKREKSIQRIAS